MGFKKKAMASANSALADLGAKAKASAAERASAADESAASALSEMRSKRAEAPAAKPASEGSFSSAFAAARRDPNKPKTFTWKGKSYTTEMAGEKKPARASAPATSGASRSGTLNTNRTETTARKTPPVPDRAAAYRNAFQRQDGRAAFSAPTPKPKPVDPRTPRKLSVDEVRTRTTGAGVKLKRTPEQERKLREAVAKTGTRSSFAKGGSIDGIAKRGKTKAKRK